MTGSVSICLHSLKSKDIIFFIVQKDFIFKHNMQNILLPVKLRYTQNFLCFLSLHAYYPINSE